MASIKYTNVYLNKLYKYFHLNIKQIAILALMLAFGIVMTAISKFTLGFLVIFNAYTIEISFFVTLITLLISNYFYASLLLIPTTFFRLGLGSEIVGVTTMFIVDLFFLTMFAFIMYLFKIFYISKLEQGTKKDNVIIIGINISVAIFVSLLSGALGVLLNWAFVLEWYMVPKDGWVAFYPFAFGTTVGKYAINITLYLATYKITNQLAHAYNTNR